MRSRAISSERVSAEPGQEWLSPAAAESVLRRARPIPTSDRPSRTPVTDILGEDLNGEQILVRLSGGNAPMCTVLMFLSASCTGCADLWSLLAPGGVGRIVEYSVGAGPVDPHDITAVGVTRTPSPAELVALKGLAPAGSTVVVSDDAWEAYGVHGPPFFVVASRGVPRVLSEGVAWGAKNVARHTMSALA